MASLFPNLSSLYEADSWVLRQIISKAFDMSYPVMFGKWDGQGKSQTKPCYWSWASVCLWTLAEEVAINSQGVCLSLL